MNVFFTCKNTLVIMLQLYRLYVVHSEGRKKPPKKSKTPDFELTSISIVAKPEMYGLKADGKRRYKKNVIEDSSLDNMRDYVDESKFSSDFDEMVEYEERKRKKLRNLQNTRKDTGYSTGSSHTSCTRAALSADERRVHGISGIKAKHSNRKGDDSRPIKIRKPVELSDESPEMKVKHEKQRRKKKIESDVSEQSESDNDSEYENKKAVKRKTVETKVKKVEKKKGKIVEISSSDRSSE